MDLIHSQNLSWYFQLPLPVSDYQNTVRQTKTGSSTTLPDPSTKQAAPLTLGTCLSAPYTSHLEVPFCSFNCPGCLLSCACPLSYPVLSCPEPGAVAVLAGEKTKPKPISPKTKAPSSSDAPVSCRVSPLSLSHPHRPAAAALRETHNLHHLPSSSSIKLALYASKFVHFSQLLHPNHI